METAKKKIVLIFTGGTICSAPSEGKNESNVRITGSYLEADFRESDSPFRDAVEFESLRLTQDILSENMTVHTWNELLDIFREKIDWKTCAGVIVMHGTDTLAYTASLLSMVLAGVPVPVCMVSAQLRLRNDVTEIVDGEEKTVSVKETRTNGYANFRAAVELIMNGIAPNVYAVYRNVRNENHEPGEFLVHLGSHLLQCPNHSDNFHSRDEMTIPDADNAKLPGVPFETDSRLIERMRDLQGDVLRLPPCVNLPYDAIRLDGFHAIVHGTYHSQSVCVGRVKDAEAKAAKPVSELADIREEDQPYSILSLIARCREQGVDVFLAPCSADSYAYGSTRDALSAGAMPIPDTTAELAYVKTMVGCAMGLRGNALAEFLQASVNHEFIYRRKPE